MPIAPSEKLIAATARLLAQEPDLSNLQLLRRLTAELASPVVASVPVNRFQRLVRDPAVHRLRAGDRKVDPVVLEGKVGKVGAPKRDGERRAGRKQRLSGQVSHEIDRALVDAFALGAMASTRCDIITRFRELDTLRRRVALLLDP